MAMRFPSSATAEVFLGYSASDVDNALAPVAVDGVDPKFDGEIHFEPKITLDNGLTIGANVQLEAGPDALTDTIDEAFVFLRGSFGEVIIGDRNSAGYEMTKFAPDVGFLGRLPGQVLAAAEPDFEPDFSRLEGEQAGEVQKARLRQGQPQARQQVAI